MPTFTTTLGEDEPGRIALVKLPFDPKATFGKARAPVVVTVRGVELRTTTMIYGGTPYIGFRRDICEQAKLAVGMRVAIAVVADNAPRVVEPPAELAAALRATPAARAAWAALSFSHQREHAQAIAGAKRADTRAARVAKTLAMLAPATPAKTPAKRAPRAPKR
jgi:hypothetical protein|nr:YdeI/OmpD-associated family protein [Kofleriaceae bacterium]